MNPNLILFRTTEGERLAAAHGHEISTIQRRALLAVNGQSSVQDLVNKVFWVENITEILQELYEMGLISGDVNTTGNQVRQAGGSGLVVQASLVALCRELLGANSEKIINKINSSPAKIPDLEGAVLSCKKVLKLTVSEKLADQFFQRAQVILNETL